MDSGNCSIDRDAFSLFAVRPFGSDFWLPAVETDVAVLFVASASSRLGSMNRSALAKTEERRAKAKSNFRRKHARFNQHR